MSGTTPSPAIVAASTPNDVIRAMVDDRGLRNTVLQAFDALAAGDKSMLGTRTFWAAILTPIVTIVGGRVFHLDNDTTMTIATALTSIAMIGMRAVTKTAVTSVLPQGTTP